MRTTFLLFGAFSATYALGPIAHDALKDCVKGMMACAVLESPEGDYQVCDPVLESSISSGNASHCHAANASSILHTHLEHVVNVLGEPSLNPDSTSSAVSADSSTTAQPATETCSGKDSGKVCEGAFIQTIHSGDPLPRTTNYTTTVLFTGVTYDPDGNIPLTGRLLCPSSCPSLPTSTVTTTSHSNSTTSEPLSSTTTSTLPTSTSSKTTSSKSSPTKTSSHFTTTTLKPTTTSKAKKPTSKSRSTSKSIVVPPKATHLPNYSERVGLAVGLGVGGGFLSGAAIAGVIALSSDDAVRRETEAIIGNAPTGPPVGADAEFTNAVGQATRDVWDGIKDVVPGPDNRWPVDLTQTSQLLAWFDNLVQVTNAGARAKGKKVAPAPPIVPPGVRPGIPGLDENPGTVWRAESGVVDFNFASPAGETGFLDLKAGDRVKHIKYAGNGWLEGSKGLKRGQFPENAISPTSSATELPKDVWSGEDGLVDGVGPQNIREWAMRDLARKRLGGMNVEPGDFLRQQMKDEHNRATDYATTQKRRQFYKDLINNPTKEPGNEYRRLVAWKQYLILKDVLKIIKAFDDQYKPEPPPVKPGPSPRPRPSPKKPPKKCRPRWIHCPIILPPCRLLPPRCPKKSG